jgi:MFS family permease
LGYNASSAGLWVLPRTALVTLGCWAAGRYLGATGRYRNFLVGVIALQVSAALGTYTWTDTTPIYFRLLCMNVEGFCFGTVLVATMVALVADIDHGDTASATSMIFLCRSIGWLSGSTITAAILQLNFKKNLNKTITGPEAAEIIEFVRTSITKIRTLAPEVQVVVISSLGQAIHTAFMYGVVCAVLCFLAALCMRNCQLGNSPAAASNKK